MYFNGHEVVGSLWLIEVGMRHGVLGPLLICLASQIGCVSRCTRATVVWYVYFHAETTVQAQFLRFQMQFLIRLEAWVRLGKVTCTQL